jgi:hypothetical protein
MVDRNDALMRELDDEVRAERYKRLWAKYGTYVIAALVAIPVATLIYQVVEQQRISSAESAGAKFEVARRLAADNNSPDAAKAFTELTKSAPTGYATLARFQSAAALVKGGKPAEAVAAFDAITTDGSADPILRDVARMQAAGLRMETADWTEMQTRLAPLTDERNAFRATARELLGLAALKAGQADEARRAFLQVISDSKASAAQRERVNAHMAGLLAASPAKAPADAAPAAGAQKP